MDIRSAELTKYASNCFLATKVSFINELAILCDKLGANIDLVREGMGTDERIGPRFLLAGPGFGGSCFPKDVQALIATARSNDHTLEICEATWRANKRQKHYVVERILNHFKDEDLSSLTVAIWGLTFKPKTDDVRESPAIDIINNLINHGVKIRAYDPKGMDNAREIFQDRIRYTDDAYEALDGTDCLAIITEWNMFKSPDIKRIKSLLKRPVIVDGRNILNASEVRSNGFTYYSIGRP
jgi:UDPglucose 6-dehydrogenase